MNKNIKQKEQTLIEQIMDTKQQGQSQIEQITKDKQQSNTSSLDALIFAEIILYILALLAFLETLDIWVRGGSDKLMTYRTAMIIVHSIFSCGFMLGGLLCAIIRNIKTINRE